MSTEQLEHQEAAQQNEVQVVKSQIPFAMAETMGMDQQGLSEIYKAPQMSFNIMPVTWSPQQLGERKRVVYQGLVEKAKTKNIFGDDPEFVYLDKAQFVEIYEGEDGQLKQRMINSFATSLVSYMRDNNVPSKAILDIVYTGKEKSRNNMMFDTFEIVLVPVNFG